MKLIEWPRQATDWITTLVYTLNLVNIQLQNSQAIDAFVFMAYVGRACVVVLVGRAHARPARRGARAYKFSTRAHL
jgi:hypothetical protein